MADFNPQIPDVQARLEIPKPISEPMADKSKGIALQTAGTAIEGGTEVVDTGIKNTIKDSLYKQVDSERDDFSSALQTMKKMVQGSPLDANAQATDKDLMPDQPPPPPSGVQRGLSTVQSLQSGMDGNKISETMYYQRLNSIAKQMRSDYPGYRDYIDQEISKISGGNPANEYLKGMINDLNHGLANKNKDQEYYEKAIVNSGYDGAQTKVQQFRSGQIGIPEVQGWLAGNATRDGEIKRKEAAFTMSSKETADVAARAETLANGVAQEAATRYFYNSKYDQNNPASGTSSQIADQMTYLANHPEARDATAITNVGIQLQAHMARNSAEMLAYVNSTKTSDGRSLGQVLGPKRVQEILDANIHNFYDTQLKLLNDKETGLVASVQNTASQIGANKVLDILTHSQPATQQIAATAMALGKIMPQMSPELQMKILGGFPGTTDDLLKANNEQIKQMIAQTGGMTDTGQGKAYTFKEIRGQLSQGRAVTHAPASSEAEAIKRTLAAGSQALREKDPRIIDNAVTAFFDPSNRGSLNGIVDDGYDAGRGVIIKGRTGAFGDLTAPDISKNIYKRSNEGHTLGWENYKNWATGEATQMLTTMAQTWNKNEDDYAKNKYIHAGGDIPGVSGKIPDRTDHHFYWDTDKHQIGYMDLEGKPIDAQTSWRANPDMFAVRNANVVLGRLRDIALTEGTNPDAFLFRTMKDAGWSPRHVDAQGKSSINANIMKAVISGNTVPEPEKKQ